MINVLFLDLFGVLIGADNSSIINYIADIGAIKKIDAQEIP